MYPLSDHTKTWSELLVYFDANGKLISRNDMHKHESLLIYDVMTKKQNRLCKGKCIQFKARKPPTGGRYEAGQYRCQTCEIYLTIQGVDGNSCRCCNFRIRSKPRNSFYKEQYHEKVRNAQDPWILTNENGNIEESTKENKNDDLETGKKSTPIYEEIDESVKTYYEFKEFLKSTPRPQVNYQFVMLKELLEYGELHKGEIAESLAYFNNKNTIDEDVVKSYFTVPVFGVLLNHEFVIESDGPLRLPYYSLNVKLEYFERIELIDYLSNAIIQYNEEHNIPENEYLSANNMGNIDWSLSNFTRKSKVEKIKNFVKKIHPISTNYWIWSITPDNWEIVKSHNVYGSRIPKERIGLKVKSGDQVAFYVIGSNCFKGIFEFVGEWYDSPGKTCDDDLEPDGSLRYKSQIKLKSIQLGSVNVPDLYEKIELFIGKPQNIRNLLLQDSNGYPSNNSRPLLKEDFETIKQDLTQNLSISEPKVEEITVKIVKECPKCHMTLEGFPGIELDNLIEESFGYRQFDPNDPKSRKPQSYCRQCRITQKTVTKSQHVDTVEIEYHNNKYVKIFDSVSDTLSIKNCKIESIDVIRKDQILTNDDIIAKFDVGTMGRIRYTKNNNVVVLLSTYSNDYDDSIDLDSGLIIYTGEGKDDQELKHGNEKILNSNNTTMVFFKEVYQEPGTRKRGALDNKYQFIGIVKYQKHYWKTENECRVIKFVLEVQS